MGVRMQSLPAGAFPIEMLCLKLDQPAEVHQGLKKSSGAECKVCKNNQNNQANNLLPTPPPSYLYIKPDVCDVLQHLSFL